MTLSRHLCREIAFQSIFSIGFHPNDYSSSNNAQVIQNQLRAFHDQKDLRKGYVLELINGIIHHMTVLQAVISQYAPEWPLENINPVDRAILYLGAYEILFEDDVPDVVVIDECIELGKKFGNENSSKFINGVLHAVMKNKPSILSAHV